jgi:hypothetical protein
MKNDLQLLEADWAFNLLIFSIINITGIINNYASLDALGNDDSENLNIKIK